jgi:hypothetical protein
MALTLCYECNKEISDLAAFCPNCGAPFQAKSNNLSSPDESPDSDLLAQKRFSVTPTEIVLLHERGAYTKWVVNVEAGWMTLTSRRIVFADPLFSNMMKLAVSALYYIATVPGRDPKIVYQALLRDISEIRIGKSGSAAKSLFGKLKSGGKFTLMPESIEKWRIELTKLGVKIID